MLTHDTIKFLVIHCSDTPDEDDIGAIEIHKMHLEFGWNGIGYHKVIKRDGKIENGRPEFWIGAHVYGKNDQSLGVCLIGRDKFSNDQFISLYQLMRKWKNLFPNAKIIGHKDLIKTNKTCPNFDVEEWCAKENLF